MSRRQAPPIVSRLATAALALLLPRVCAVCGAPDRGAPSLVCDACRAMWVPIGLPRCARCGHARRGVTCGWCGRLPPYVRAARSSVWYPDGGARGAVVALKYGGWWGVAAALAEAMARAEWPDDVRRERAALVPVPLGARRGRRRGYNQAAALADALQRQVGLPVWREALVRRRETRSQTRLTPSDRVRNVSAAFEVPAAARARLRGRHLVLVDDVITTAATLNACAAALVEGGARVVSYWSFGRARAPGDEPPDRAER